MISEWAHVPLHYSLPLARLGVDEQLLWSVDDEHDGTGDRILTWMSGGRPGPVPATTGAMSVVSVVWGEFEDIEPDSRDRAESLVGHAGRRLRGLASLGVADDDLRAPWLDAVLGAIPTPAALLFPVRDSGGDVVEFVIDRCNVPANDLMRRTPGQITGRRLLETFPGLVLAGVFEDYARVLRTGEPLSRGPFPYEEQVRGVLYPAVLSVKAQRVGDGLLVSWQFHDEQARLAARLSDAERLVHLGWADWNLVTKEITWSRRMYDMIGRDPASGPASLEQLVQHVVDADRPAVVDALNTLSAHAKPVTFDFRVAHTDTERFITATIEPVTDTLGRLIARRGVLQDVTVRRLMEQALAESRMQLEEHRHRMAEEFQRALLPRVHAELPGLRIAVCYQPAEDCAFVGGDWYEAAPLPDGRVLIAIGDASGHGLPAAARMAQLRNALLGIAYTGAGTETILDCLNSVVFHNQETTDTATAIVASFDPAGRTLRWARAGHPPPVLVRDGRARELRNDAGTVLGATERPGYQAVTEPLSPGDRVVLYTDGLIEDRADRTDARIGLLLDAAARCDGGDPETDLRDLLAALRTTNPGDDTCLVVLHVTEEPR